MGNSKIKNTIIQPLCLHRENITLKSVLCLSKFSFSELKNLRNNYLHQEEEHYYKLLTNPRRQFAYLIGRYCAKLAIGTYISAADMASILIRKGIFEQPIVYYPACPNIQISISHTDNLGAALSFCESHPMAIDVETICQSKCEVIKSQITSAEHTLLHPNADSTIQLVTLWTVKEALSKILKCGFTLSFELLEVKNQLSQENITISYFKHFIQYKAISFVLGDSICSLVLPRKTHFDIKADIINTMLEAISA